MTDVGSTRENVEQVGQRPGQHGAESPDGTGDPADLGRDDWRDRDDWRPEPERHGRRGWLFAAFAVVVVAIAAAVLKLATGDPAVAPLGPVHLAAPVTLPPAPNPPPRPSTAQSSAAGTAGAEICPGSDGVSADDQPGWQHDAVQADPADPASSVACAGRYSLHTTSTAGGVSYRWTFDVDQAGHCDIAVYVPDTPRADVARVHYTVLDGDTVVEGFVIAQARDRGQFVPAGSYPAGGGPLTVRMDNQSPVAGTVVASAVRFTCQPG
ncbi:MAG TPA: hypothetical protein VFX70_22250 [Mycobacteriales bacterium]|nr:hypothetical protein [Mycobacteriales bacterium]